MVNPNTCTTTNNQRKCMFLRRGFTLVEILVTTTLLLLLAAVALPSVKSTLQSQKESQTARQIVAYIESARSRAITSQERVGVLIDRAGPFDEFSRSYSYELRQTSTAPAYRGDSDNTQAVLIHDDFLLTAPGLPNSGSQVRDGLFNACVFRSVENPLLLLAAQLLNDGDATNDHLAPIQAGDFISFSGGRRLRILAIGTVDANDTVLNSFTAGTPPSPSPPWDPTNNAFTDWNLLTDATYIKVRFDSRNLVSPGATASTFAWPGGSANAQPGRRWIASQFTIHRTPTVSSIAPLRLPKSMCIDLNYSGVGPSGVDFSPFVMDPFADNRWVGDTATREFGPIAIVFAPDGSVDYLIWFTASGPVLTPLAQRPVGQIFFMLGNVDGIRPDDLFSEDEKALANILNPSSVWITINPTNGGVLVSPNVPLASSSIPPATLTNEVRLAQAVLSARALAFESATVEAK